MHKMTARSIRTYSVRMEISTFHGLVIVTMLDTAAHLMHTVRILTFISIFAITQLRIRMAFFRFVAVTKLDNLF